MKTLLQEYGKGTILFVLTIMLFAVVTLGVWGFNYATADIRGKSDAQVQLKSAPNRINAYNQFFDACTSITALEFQIDAQDILLKSAVSTFEQEKIRANIAGLQGMRASAIEAYNADAAKDWTVGQFKDSRLPYHLDNSLYQPGGTKTECGL